MRPFFFFFFFNDTATTEIYTLSLHDALPISHQRDDLRALQDFDVGRRVDALDQVPRHGRGQPFAAHQDRDLRDRKSTRLNSSHLVISYAVFCLKKKKKTYNTYTARAQS